MTTYFKVVKRNVAHWDFVGEQGRLFRLRGTPGEWLAMDERERPHPVTKFKTFSSALLFITETLMHEDVAQDPKSPSNNIPLP